MNDEDVVPFMHFVNGFRKMFSVDGDDFIARKYADVKNFLKNKKEGDFDNRDILRIKALICRVEARTACAYNGIPKPNIHFLALPFYESGKIEKFLLSSTDVDIVCNLLEEVKPHQIYVAGDLQDPRGTHRKCTDAVFAAIREESARNARWLFRSVRRSCVVNATPY